MENKAVPALTQSPMQFATISQPSLLQEPLEGTGESKTLGLWHPETFWPLQGDRLSLPVPCSGDSKHKVACLMKPLSWYPGPDPGALCRWQLAQVVGARYHMAPQQSLKGSN